jgi:hypothetical protein
MTPHLVTPPASLPVSLADMKAHLRAAHNDDDADIDAKQAGAVAMLDGWGGLLGRCIMPQVWAIDVEGPGPHLLPFPDATGVAAGPEDNPVGVEVTRTALGPVVTVSVPEGDAVTVRATYGLPATRLPAAQSLVKLMVQRDFDVMAGPDYDAITRSIQALVTALRVVRL